VVGTSISQLAGGAPLFNPDQVAYILLIGGGLVILQAIFVAMHVYAFKVTVAAEGLTGYSYGIPNRRRYLDWADIDLVERSSYLGMPCYRLTSPQKKISIIILKCLNNLTEFEAALKYYNLDLEKKISAAAIAQPTARKRDVAESGARKRELPEPIREGGYIVVTTEQRATKSR
jgi:hypothetical protein